MINAGKVALVLGGTSGIGEGTARALIAAGVDVVVSSRSQPDTNLLEHPRIQFIAADIADTAHVGKLVDRVIEDCGRLDYAVNCAGYEGEFHPINDYPDHDFRKVIEINLLGTFNALKHQVRVMRTQKRGAIVNLASIAGLKGVPMASPYAASKHAIIGLTRSVALEVVGIGIRVNALCPALVDTHMADRLSAKTGLTEAQLVSANPMQRAAQVGEVAATILWLLSDQSSFITGQCISVDGGQSIA